RRCGPGRRNRGRRHGKRRGGARAGPSMNNLYSEDDITSAGLRRFAPAATILLASLLMTLPIPLAWAAMPNIAFLLLIIWASLQPRLVPVWAAFLLGLFADFLFGLPMGVWAVLFPATAVIVRLAEARVEGHSLGIDWAFAALLLVLGHLVASQLMDFAGRAPAVLPMLVQAGLSIIAYPMVASIAARVQRRLIDVGA
ncbi:rod shape-determining protein MreD, partial [Sandaracinobacter sp. RS1-74]|uniref:rod shape-determining protein MreD n=1 Tax=Sandaracinobacteroides sayramensis TaxID=2913411 RepID=UPI001EDBADFB